RGAGRAAAEAPRSPARTGGRGSGEARGRETPAPHSMVVDGRVRAGRVARARRIRPREGAPAPRAGGERGSASHRVRAKGRGERGRGAQPEPGGSSPRRREAPRRLQERSGKPLARTSRDRSRDGVLARSSEGSRRSHRRAPANPSGSRLEGASVRRRIEEEG